VLLLAPCWASALHLLLLLLLLLWTRQAIGAAVADAVW
jgi:hypothetical protein